MKNKTKLSLAALVMTTALSTANLNAQNQKRPNLDGTINNIELSNKKTDAKYSATGTVYFDYPGTKNDVGFYHIPNEDISENELSFGLVPEKYGLILYDSENNTSIVPYKNPYIPNRIVDENGEILQAMELPGLDAKIKNKLKNKARKKSTNNWGYTYEQLDKDVKRLFPRTTVEGENFIYLNAKWGNLFTEDDKGKTNYYFTKSDKLIDLVLIPEEDFSWTVNPSNGEVMVFSEDGFYRPIMDGSNVNMVTKKTKALIPTKTTTKTTTTKTTTTTQTATSKTEKYIYHKVLKGETYSSMAKKYYGNENQWKEIYKKNPETAPKMLKPGQEIKIPVN